MTTSQVSMETWPKPFFRAASTSGELPWLNQSVSRRRMSCSLAPRRGSPADPATCLCASLLQ